MTDRPTTGPDRPAAPAARPARDHVGSLPVVTAAGVAFCVALIFLALQMRAGEDPALGSGGGEAAAAPRPVIVRRVVVRRIVEEPAGRRAAAPSAPAASAPAGPAPAPAAPAPVTTQAS